MCYWGYALIDLILSDSKVLHEKSNMVWVVGWVHRQYISKLHFMRVIANLNIQSEHPSVFVRTYFLPLFYPQLKLIFFPSILFLTLALRNHFIWQVNFCLVCFLLLPHIFLAQIFKKVWIPFVFVLVKISIRFLLITKSDFDSFLRLQTDESLSEFSCSHAKVIAVRPVSQWENSELHSSQQRMSLREQFFPQRPHRVGKIALPSSGDEKYPKSRFR